MSFTIVIASHGDDHWRDLAWSRAWPSAQDQGAEVLIEHDPDATRAEVRNRLIEQARGDWIITLDADDELDPGYVEAMDATRMRRVYQDKWAEPCLMTPQVAYVRGGRRRKAFFWPEVELKRNNWLVVGTAAPRSLMLEVGGWRTFTGSGVLNEWDDWDMWIRCVKAGAEIERVPGAVYVAHVLRTSWAQTTTEELRRAWIREIREANWPDAG